MLIHPGTSVRLLKESTLQAGTTTKLFSPQSDSVLISVWVSSLPAGTVTVELLEVLDAESGKESVVLTLPVISAPSVAVLSQQSGTITSNCKIRVTYPANCEYELYVRAVGPVSSGSISGSVSITGGTIDTITNPVTVTGTVEVDEGIVQEMLNAPDLNAVYTWLDFGTRNERIDTITYTAPSVTAQVLTKQFAYTAVSGKYRQDSVTFSLI